jgi:hypothetical protein
VSKPSFLTYLLTLTLTLPNQVTLEGFVRYHLGEASEAGDAESIE